MVNMRPLRLHSQPWGPQPRQIDLGNATYLIAGSHRYIIPTVISPSISPCYRFPLSPALPSRSPGSPDPREGTDLVIHSAISRDGNGAGR